MFSRVEKCVHLPVQTTYAKLVEITYIKGQPLSTISVAQKVNMEKAISLINSLGAPSIIIRILGELFDDRSVFKFINMIQSTQYRVGIDF